MGTRNSVVDGRDQSLLNNNNEIREQPNEGDVHLSIGQPTMKNTLAIKNPFLLKKESLTIERDSVERNFYYLSFKYDSLIDFNVRIILLGKSVKNNKDTLYQSILSIGNENSQFSYLNFTCTKGFDVKFDNPTCKIDSSLFDNREEFHEVEHDLIIEFTPIDFPTTDPLAFYTLCSLNDEKITENNRVYKLKVDSQRLRAQSMVLEINELFLAHRDQGECLICYEKLANTVLLPCRHSCCSVCAHGLRLRNLPCPMCKNSKYLILLFFSY